MQYKTKTVDINKKTKSRRNRIGNVESEVEEKAGSLYKVHIFYFLSWIKKHMVYLHMEAQV